MCVYVNKFVKFRFKMHTFWGIHTPKRAQMSIKSAPIVFSRAFVSKGIYENARPCLKLAEARQKEADRYSLHMLRPQYKMFEIDSRLRYFKPHASKVERTFAEEISGSLGRGSGSKFIDPKFFYDEVGSALFEEICSVPEYYLTRTEIALLERIADEIGALVAAYAPSVPDNGVVCDDDDDDDDDDGADAAAAAGNAARNRR